MNATYSAPARRPRVCWVVALGMAVDETARVESVTDGGATDKLMTVEVGWRVVSIGGTEVSDADACEAAVGAQRGKEFDVMFERTLPPMPQRGWARKVFAQKRGRL